MPDGIHPAFRDAVDSSERKMSRTKSAKIDQDIASSGVPAQSSAEIKKPSSMESALKTNLSRDKRDMRTAAAFANMGNLESQKAQEEGESKSSGKKVRRDKF